MIRGREAPFSGFRGFTILWAGQFISLAASAVSSFALGVYCYLETDSVTTLAVLYALPFVPFLIVSPFAGALVDRWGSKRALLISNGGCMLVALGMAVLLVTDTFAIWQVYFVVVLMSALRALDLPAFEAALPLMVPQRDVGRATGMRLLAVATGSVLGPVLAGILLLAVGIQGIVVGDCLSFLFALAGLALVRIPRLPLAETATGHAALSVRQDAVAGWRHLTARPGLLSLTALLGVMSFGIGFGELVLPPLVLAFSTPDGLGVVLTLGALGMVVVSGAISVWAWPRRERRIGGLLAALFLFAFALALASLRPNLAVLAVATFLFMGCATIVTGIAQTIWQSKVEPHMLGRTVALRNAIALAPQLVGNLLAGLLCVHVAVPLVGEDEVRSETVALLVGDGPGRGYALALTVLGVLTALAVAWIGRSPRLRRIDEELPDVIAADWAAVSHRLLHESETEDQN
ncbi:MFS transporter [Streptomyces sp. NPDC005571]|uniref:MFS transporter n=1 Tax=Streptomyces sp. NPDC005571 TaxID=3156888 RepID=UPI0033A174E0